MSEVGVCGAFKSSSTMTRKAQMASEDNKLGIIVSIHKVPFGPYSTEAKKPE